MSFLNSTKTIDFNDLLKSLNGNLENPLLICLKYNHNDYIEKKTAILSSLKILNNYKIDFQKDLSYFSDYYFMNTLNNIKLNDKKSSKKSLIKFNERNFKSTLNLSFLLKSKGFSFEEFLDFSKNNKVILVDNIFSLSNNYFYENCVNKIILESISKNKIFNSDIKNAFHDLINSLTFYICQTNKHLIFIYGENSFEDNLEFAFKKHIMTYSDVVLTIRGEEFFLNKSRIKI